MDHQKPSWAWILVLAPLLFVLHLALFAYRFERIQNVVTGAIFLPAGLFSAVGLIYWLRDSHSARQKRNTWIGYLLGIPFAFLGSLLLPLLLPPWIGATLGGALPWLFTTWVGYRLPETGS